MIGLAAIPFLKDGDKSEWKLSTRPQDRLTMAVVCLGFLAGSIACLILDHYDQVLQILWLGPTVTLGVWFISGLTVLICNRKIFFPGKQ